ncbi:doublesex- and mab-3-related transcription factor B1 [Cynocephalus volans]|uniref:doublesex- and mab-3-related transcription factor B1 n=1 Tax=Cynocephalus volans TaxID=110931 RepID=UPI002FC5FFE1
MLRTPKCSRCRNHGFLVPVKGHAGRCRWKQCDCEKCYLITERQKIMAAQKVLKKQASDEEQEVALCVPGPEVASGAASAAASAAVASAPGSSLSALPPLAASGVAEPGPQGRAAVCFPERPPPGPSPGPSAFQPVLGGCGPLGPSRRATGAMPSIVGPQLGAEAAGRGCPGHLEPRRPLRPVPSLPFADHGKIIRPCHSSPQQCPGPLYPSCSSMHSYRPFPLGYQDASPTPGIPLQQGFRHVSCSHYHGGGLVSEPVGDLQPSYYPPPLPPQPQVLPPGFLSALHFLPPPPPPPSPPSFSLTVLSDTDKENADDQEAEVLREPSQPSSQEQSN